MGKGRLSWATGVLRRYLFLATCRPPARRRTNALTETVGYERCPVCSLLLLFSLLRNFSSRQLLSLSSILCLISWAVLAFLSEVRLLPTSAFLQCLSAQESLLLFCEQSFWAVLCFISASFAPFVPNATLSQQLFFNTIAEEWELLSCAVTSENQFVFLWMISFHSNIFPVSFGLRVQITKTSTVATAAPPPNREQPPALH